MKKELSIAVTGLHRGTNPQPGPGIIRSLRRVRSDLHIVGLVYDAYESGIFAEEGPDACAAMPYPTVGAEAWIERLDEVRAGHPIDVLLPTLDAEVAMLVHARDELERRGIRCWLPGSGVLDRRSKARLPELAGACGVATPETAVARDPRQAVQVAREAGFPLLLKGPIYGARRVADEAQLAAACAAVLAEWGPPLILQAPVAGHEFDVLGVGDGAGGLAGTCAVRKTMLSDEGKGLAAVTVRDPELDELTRRIIAELRWPGPFEIEFIRSAEDGAHQLIEFNPRFPAWIDFPSQIGVNFPAALLEQILGGSAPPLPQPLPGRFFLRHQVEVVGDLGQVAALLGELARELPGEAIGTLAG
jgi:carbamoyl-phosphate synthase large subunit